MLIDNKFSIGDTVYLKTDKGQSERIITSIQVTSDDLTYCLSCGVDTTWHYAIEISKEKNVLISVS